MHTLAFPTDSRRDRLAWSGKEDVVEVLDVEFLVRVLVYCCGLRTEANRLDVAVGTCVGCRLVVVDRVNRF